MEIVGSIGVAILLLAFFGNLVGRFEASSRSYQGMNALGAAIAAYASWGIGLMPFVVLEGSWCVVACVAIVNPRRPTGAEESQ